MYLWVVHIVYFLWADTSVRPYMFIFFTFLRLVGADRRVCPLFCAFVSVCPLGGHIGPPLRLVHGCYNEIYIIATSFTSKINVEYAGMGPLARVP